MRHASKQGIARMPTSSTQSSPDHNPNRCLSRKITHSQIKTYFSTCVSPSRPEVRLRRASNSYRVRNKTDSVYSQPRSTYSVRQDVVLKRRAEGSEAVS